MPRWHVRAAEGFAFQSRIKAAACAVCDGLRREGALETHASSSDGNLGSTSTQVRMVVRDADLFATAMVFGSAVRTRTT